jgi:hypothetical protein
LFILGKKNKMPVDDTRPTSKFGYRPIYTGLDLQGMSDTEFTDPLNLGDVMVYDGTDWINTDNLSRQAATQRFYRGSFTAGNTNNETFYIPAAVGANAVLASINCRWDYPFTTDSALIRFWRYRKVNGVFSYTQITNSVTFDSTDDWSVWHDISDQIRASGRDLNQLTDMVAITVVYTTGATPTVQAFNCTFTIVQISAPNEAVEAEIPFMPAGTLPTPYPPA